MGGNHFAISIYLSMLMILGFGVGSVNAQSPPFLDLTDAKLREGIQYLGFITSKPIVAWGTIVGTKDAAVNLSEGEIVYLQVEPTRAVKAGDRFAILQQAQEVIHPESRKKMGHLIVIAGEVIILGTQEGMATGRINKSFRSILVEDRIAPVPQPPADRISIRPMKKLHGRVLLALEGTENITQKEIIFIDRGAYHGVIVGDRFSICRPSNVSAEVSGTPRGPLPMITVGEGVVISVEEESATALVVKSFQAIYVGDQIVSSGP